jgi:hypothetical protein
VVQCPNSAAEVIIFFFLGLKRKRRKKKSQKDRLTVAGFIIIFLASFLLSLPFVVVDLF